MPAVFAVRNKTLVNSYEYICYDDNYVTSQGIFIGEHPLDFSLPLLLAQICLIFLLSNALHFFLRKLGQPRFVSQVLTGIVVGPCVLGERFGEAMFPARGAFILDTIGNVGLILFLFSISLRTDLSLLRRPGWRAVAVGAAGSLVPLGISVAYYYSARRSFPMDLRHSSDLVISLASRLSLSSFPVIGDALLEHGLLNSDLGRMAMASSIITDVCNWGITALLTALRLIIIADSPRMAAATVSSLAAFTLFVIFVARPAALRAARATPSGELLKEGVFITLVVAALLSAFTTEASGFHIRLGPAILGLAMPGGMPMGVTLSERLDPLLSGLLIPLYLALTGFRANFAGVGDWSTWGTLEVIVIICFFGKLLAIVLCGLYCRMPLRDAFVLALMLNIKGILEVSSINSFGESQMATVERYSVVLLSLLCITAVCTPVIKYLYDPNIRYIPNKRRTLEHMKPDSDFRILVAVSSEEDDVPLVLEFLDSLHPHPPSPLNLHLLHLTELSGSAASVLRRHPLRPTDPSNPCLSDRIVSAFRHFSLRFPNASLQIHPFVAASPHATMHNDVCLLALQRKARLVLLPFHRRGFVQQVLDHAPCSVAVAVAAAKPTAGASRFERAAVLFLGGADDREALAVGMRMAGGGVAVTVVRLSPRAQFPQVAEDEAMLQRARGSQGVDFVHRVVGNGEETVGIVRGIGERFDLAVVGRRKGEEGQAVTKGMEDWTDQCPELGLIGDMLAVAVISPDNDDAGMLKAILVVQQQPWQEDHFGVS